MIHNLPDDWNCYDEGDQHIYTTDPGDIPVRMAPRVIYELRCDVERLCSEIRDINERAAE